MKRTQRQVVEERKAARGGRVAREKYVEQNEKGLAQFKPTQSQQDMINEVSRNTITFVEGPAGVGKTAGVLWWYCKQYLIDSTKKIMVVRTPVEAASLDKVGFLPDDLAAKTAPHFESTKNILNTFLGKGKVECDTDNRIFFKIPNYMVGSTFDSSLILVDEAQLLQPMIMKLILERTGLNSKVVVCGDTTQIYANSREANQRNGMGDALSRFVSRNGTPKFDDIGYYRFSVDDVQRSEIVKTVIKAYS